MLNRLKISLVLAPIALTILIGVYIYTLWSRESQIRAEMPLEATTMLGRDLVKFHQKKGSFPLSLQDLEGTIWEKKERRYASDGRALIHRNYYYLYTRVEPHRYTLWAFPVGSKRDEAPTLFVSGTPQKGRTWKGPIIPMSDLGSLASVPTLTELGILGLVEQRSPSQSSDK